MPIKGLKNRVYYLKEACFIFMNKTDLDVCNCYKSKTYG